MVSTVMSVFLGRSPWRRRQCRRRIDLLRLWTRLKPKSSPGGLAGLNDSIRHQQNPVAGVQGRAGPPRVHIGQNSQRQAAWFRRDGELC